MAHPDSEEANLHLWAEFNLPEEARLAGPARATPLGASLQRGRRLAALAAATGARHAEEAEQPLPGAHLGLA